MDTNETTAGLIEEMKKLKYENDVINRILEQTNLQLRDICAKLKNMNEELKEERIKRNREELAGDEFDGFLDKYKSKLLKKIDTIEKVGESGATFQEVEYSD